MITMAKMLIPTKCQKLNIFSKFLQISIRKGVLEIMGPKLAMDYYFLLVSCFRTAVPSAY